VTTPATAPASAVPATPATTTTTSLEFEKRLQSGLEASRRLELERALIDFEACTRLDPQHAQALFHRGRTLLALERHDSGLETVEAAVKLAPGNVRFQRFLMELFNNYEPLKDVERATTHLSEVRKHSGEDLVNFEMQLASDKARQTTVEAFQLAAKILQNKKEDPSPALQELRQAFFPPGFEDPKAYQGVPGYQKFQEIFAKKPALHQLKEAVAEKLTNPSRIGLEAVADDRMAGSTLPLETARRLYEDVLDYSVYNTPVQRQTSAALASLALKMGDFEDAVIRFERLLVFDTTEDVRHRNTFHLGVANYRDGSKEEAKAHFEELMRGGPMKGVHAGWLLHLLGGPPPPRPEMNLPNGFLDGFRFANAAKLAGVAKKDGVGSSAWGDYDGDADFDLFVSGSGTHAILYQYENGRFVDASNESGLKEVRSGFSNMFVDYDSDGDLDLFIARGGWTGPAPNSLYQNQGDGTFLDVSEKSGLRNGESGSSFTAAWADFDKDADLDLFVTNGICGDGSTNKLFDNQGDGTFNDVTADRGVLEATGTKTVGCAIGDFNLDGTPDIFLSGYAPTPNRLYRNRGDGVFQEMGFAANVADTEHNAKGSVAFMEDFSGDGLPDIVVTKWEPDFRSALYGMAKQYRSDSRLNTPRYFRNSGNETFEDVSEEAGFKYPHGTMGAGVGDLNNDGFLDIFLGNGGPAIDRLEPDSLYANIGGRRFENISHKVSMDHIEKAHGVSMADIDKDGDLDLYITFGGVYPGDFTENALYVNHPISTGNWLQIDLAGSRSNRMAIGAQVTVKAGALTVFREKKCGVGFGAGDGPYLHFGLGAAEKADSIVVRWPSGRQDNFQNIAANRILLLTEGTAEQKATQDSNVEHKTAPTPPTTGAPRSDEEKTQFADSERLIGDIKYMFGEPDKTMHPPINEPVWIDTKDAKYLNSDDMVFVLRGRRGETRLYPELLLAFHHVVNDVLEEKPVAITYCMLANSAILYSRSGTFHALGTFYLGNLAMYDNETDSYWNQLRGDCYHGARKGEHLTNLGGVERVSWNDARKWLSAKVLQKPNSEYDYREFYNSLKGTQLGLKVLQKHMKPDPRLPPFTEGLGVLVRGDARFFPASHYRESTFLQTDAGGWSLLIVADKENGATRMYRRYLDGHTLEFETDGENLKDKGTQYIWNREGVCVEGTLQGSRLEMPAYSEAYWYAWASFYPKTLIAVAADD
jgi:tetratricopeptide (TPR) repeat protein